jgi:hypothetical protein
MDIFKIEVFVINHFKNEMIISLYLRRIRLPAMEASESTWLRGRTHWRRKIHLAPQAALFESQLTLQGERDLPYEQPPSTR